MLFETWSLFGVRVKCAEHTHFHEFLAKYGLEFWSITENDDRIPCIIIIQFLCMNQNRFHFI